MDEPLHDGELVRVEHVSGRALVGCIDWVMDQAPAPAALVGVLLVIARCCDDDGRGSAQTVAVIAEKAGKSEGQARRDIARLRELGLLLLGDQSLVDHLPNGQRPTVYDLPIHISGPKVFLAPRHRPERIAPEGKRRRAIPASVQAAVYQRDGHRCVACGTLDDLTLDHIYPWARGGPDTIDNLRVLCRPCNSRKGARIMAGA
ncbi:HNH endonuclease [Micromonospora carbonacea]|nr:HNH endonuclease [Micromonospora carbonacea]